MMIVLMCVISLLYKSYDFDSEIIVDELLRVIKNDGAAVLILSSNIINGIERGTDFKQSMNFINKGFVPQKYIKSFDKDFNEMFLFSKGTINNEIKNVCERIISYTTLFPYDLSKEYIISFTNENGYFFRPTIWK